MKQSLSRAEDTVDRVSLWRDKEVKVTSLSGGLTNENYLVEAGGQRYVIRIPGASTELLAIRFYGYRMLTAIQRGQIPGPEAAMSKVTVDFKGNGGGEWPPTHPPVPMVVRATAAVPDTAITSPRLFRVTE